MGSIISARCDCGYEKNDMLLGGGMENFTTGFLKARIVHNTSASVLVCPPTVENTFRNLVVNLFINAYI